MNELFNKSLIPAIQWHEGMLLSPHHFQQNDRRFEQIFIQHFHLISPHHWGVHGMKLDPLQLPDGLIRILNLQAIMPDGLIIDYDASKENMPTLELDVKPFKPDLLRGSLTIYLTLPEWIEGVSPLAGEWARYLSVEGNDTRDINLDENPIKIPRLFPKLSLQVCDTLPTRYVGFPLLKIGFRDESFVQMDYLPPCFYIRKETSLWQMSSALCQKIREKAIYLCDKWQNQIGTPLLQETSNLLRPLLMSLPSLEVTLNNPGLLPYNLYQKLAEVIGHLTSLRLSQVPPILPVYQHNDLLGCLTPLLDLIKQYLDSIEISFAIFSFNQKDRLFYLSLNPSFVADKLYVGLRAPNGMSEAELEEWMNDCVITSDFAVESVRSRRITGATRRVLRNEDLYEIMPSRGVVVFEIDNQPEYVKPEQNLNIFNPADTPEKRPSEIVLYVRKGRS